MGKKDDSYFINNPIRVRYNQYVGPFRIRNWRQLKSVVVNERIIENPFALQCLGTVPLGAKVLDLGCMESSLPLQMAGLGYQVTGLDLRQYPYVHPNFTFIEGDLLHLPFEEGSYDAVFSVSTVEHIGIGSYKNPKEGEGSDHQAVVEIYRVLKSRGVFGLTVPFGVATVDKHQRVYDQKGVERLIDRFSVQEMRYFANSKDMKSRANFWEEVGREKASQITNADCVCLVKAIK